MNKMQSCDLIRTPLVDLPNALLGQQVSVDWDRRYWSRQRSDIAQELADFWTGIDAYFSITFDLRRSVMLVALDSLLSRATAHLERRFGFGFSQQLSANADQS
jgi:hypothetical protein